MAMATQKLLSESMELFARLDPGSTDAAVAAFVKFRRGVEQACNGRNGSSQELLRELEPKEAVLKVLPELLEKKKMYRKQIQSVFAELLRVDLWLSALIQDQALCDSLPAELSATLKDLQQTPTADPNTETQGSAVAVAPQALEPPPDNASVAEIVQPPQGTDDLQSTESVRVEVTTECPQPVVSVCIEDVGSSAVPSCSEVHAAHNASGVHAAVRNALERSSLEKQGNSCAQSPSPPLNVDREQKSSPQKSLEELLSESMAEFAKLRPGITDAGISAFSDFRKLVAQACGGRHGASDALLGDLEPKEVVLRFLAELHEKRKIHRGQIRSVFVDLLSVDSWLNALVHNETLCKSLPAELAAILNEKTGCPQAESHLADTEVSSTDQMENTAVASLDVSESAPVESLERITSIPSSTPTESPKIGVSEDGPSRADVHRAVRNAMDSYQSRGVNQNPSDCFRSPLFEVASDHTSPTLETIATQRNTIHVPPSSCIAPSAAEIREAVQRSLNQSSPAELSTAIKVDEPLAMLAGIKVADSMAYPKIESNQNKVSEEPDLLKQACQQMKLISHDASHPDACKTFESFKKAVMRLVQTNEMNCCPELTSCEPKASILSFLLGVHEKERLLRSQVKAVLIRLRSLDAWRRVMSKKSDTRSKIQAIVADGSAAPPESNDRCHLGRVQCTIS